MATTVTLAIGENDSKIAYFLHSTRTVHGAPPVNKRVQHSSARPIALQSFAQGFEPPLRHELKKIGLH